MPLIFEEPRPLISTHLILSFSFAVIMTVLLALSTISPRTFTATLYLRKQLDTSNPLIDAFPL